METRTAWNTLDMDAYEMERSRQYAYLVRIALNIRRFTAAYNQTKKQDNWAIDPRFTRNNALGDQWIAELPADLQIVPSSGDSSPWLSSHFMGSLNIYHHISVILQHRPQLAALEQVSHDDSWRDHMARCFSSARTICHLQEAIASDYGLSGLGFLQRGIHFTVYSILTCLTVHLVCHQTTLMPGTKY